MLKQSIVIRRDLKMGKGKIAAHCSHASLEAALKSDQEILKKWMKEGAKKVVLKVGSEKELKEIFDKSKKEKMVSVLIRDAGLTQLKKGTATAVAIGPDDEKKINKITGKLKLL